MQGPSVIVWTYENLLEIDLVHKEGQLVHIHMYEGLKFKRVQNVRREEDETTKL